MDDIVEVVKTSPRNANAFLEHGYRLLAVEQEADVKQHPTPENQQGWFVQKYVVCVLGRPQGVAHFDLPKAPAPKREPVAVPA